MTEVLQNVIPGKKDFKLQDLSSYVKEKGISFNIYNTRTKKVEEFVPVKEGHAGMYTCGPTVYKNAHIGNIRTYISEDILKRALIMYGYKVKHIMNITDVGHLTDDNDDGEDKMEKSAKEMNMDAWHLASYYFDKFREDFEATGNLDPTMWTTATGHIPEQIEIIKGLEEKGYTYRTSDGIYFDTSKFPEYPDFGQIDVENLRGGSRVELSSEKRNVTDFALWKFSDPSEKRQMEWDSPWGVGFPGWHLECSALAIKYLGERLDIHAGGTDHIKVHHTNEIAQSECYLGHEWCNYWFHCEHLVLPGNRKMSKSSGNFSTVDSIKAEGFSPVDYRYFCLNANYNKHLVFTGEGLESAKTSLDRLKKRIIEIRKNATGEGQHADAFKEEFFRAIYDDLNVSKALGVLWNLLKDSQVSDSDKYSTVLLFDDILNLGLKDVKEEETEIPDEVRELMKERDEARKNKDYALSDELRDRIASFGFKVKDSKEGTQVEKI